MRKKIEVKTITTENGSFLVMNIGKKKFEHKRKRERMARRSRKINHAKR